MADREGAWLPDTISLAVSRQDAVMQVTTMRSRSSMKPTIPLLNDPVEKLEGLGSRTKANLSDVRASVRHIDGRVASMVPPNAPNNITTGTAP